jgi:hypothetical protein
VEKKRSLCHLGTKEFFMSRIFFLFMNVFTLLFAESIDPNWAEEGDFIVLEEEEEFYQELEDE